MNNLLIDNNTQWVTGDFFLAIVFSALRQGRKSDFDRDQQIKESRSYFGADFEGFGTRKIIIKLDSS